MTEQPKLFSFECKIRYSSDYIVTDDVIAETASKARYKFYKSLDAGEPYSEYFRYISSRKQYEVDCDYVPPISDYEQAKFDRVIESRGIEFARIGMKISVDGQMGIIIGANSSCNLDINFGNGHKSNCHPHWKTIYYDDEGTIIKSYK